MTAGAMATAFYASAVEMLTTQMISSAVRTEDARVLHSAVWLAVATARSE
jgi:hypothetical protein